MTKKEKFLLVSTIIALVLAIGEFIGCLPDLFTIKNTNASKNPAPSEDSDEVFTE